MMHPQQDIPQHKITPLKQVWSPPTTSGLEMERVYCRRSRKISQEVNE